MEEIVKIEEVHTKGWKGKDEVSILDKEGGYLLIFHRKHKETKEVYTNEVFVPKQDAVDLWDIIRTKCSLGVEYKYRYLVRAIIQSGRFKFEDVIRSFKDFDNEIKEIKSPKLNEKYYNFLSDLAIETFNGGRFRKAIYFPALYNPLIILQEKGMIIFWGRGGITRISEQKYL